MENAPVHSFFMRMKTYHPHDIAVLWGMVAMQEIYEGPIPVTVEKRLWCVDLPPESIQDSIMRLAEAGEIEEGPQGYVVLRYEDLASSMTVFGKRRYERKRRERLTEVGGGQ